MQLKFSPHLFSIFYYYISFFTLKQTEGGVGIKHTELEKAKGKSQILFIFWYMVFSFSCSFFPFLMKVVILLKRWENPYIQYLYHIENLKNHDDREPYPFIREPYKKTWFSTKNTRSSALTGNIRKWSKNIQGMMSNCYVLRLKTISLRSQALCIEKLKTTTPNTPYQSLSP